MKKDTVVDLAGRDTIADPLSEMLRTGAQRLIEKAVEVELQELLEHHRGRHTEDGRAGVVRNGYLPERELQTGVGPVTIRIPKVRAKTGEPVIFRSAGGFCVQGTPAPAARTGDLDSSTQATARTSSSTCRPSSGRPTTSSARGRKSRST